METLLRKSHVTVSVVKPSTRFFGDDGFIRDTPLVCQGVCGASRAPAELFRDARLFPLIVAGCRRLPSHEIFGRCQRVRYVTGKFGQPPFGGVANFAGESTLGDRDDKAVLN
jgi:hypothetical protein